MPVRRTPRGRFFANPEKFTEKELQRIHAHHAMRLLALLSFASTAARLDFLMPRFLRITILTPIFGKVAVGVLSCKYTPLNGDKREGDIPPYIHLNMSLREAFFEHVGFTLTC